MKGKSEKPQLSPAERRAAAWDKAHPQYAPGKVSRRPVAPVKPAPGQPPARLGGFLHG